MRQFPVAPTPSGFWQQPPGACRQEGPASTGAAEGGGRIPFLPRQAPHLTCRAKLLSCDQILSSHLPTLLGWPACRRGSPTALLRVRRWGQSNIAWKPVRKKSTSSGGSIANRKPEPSSLTAPQEGRMRALA